MKFKRTIEIEKGRILEMTPLIDVVLNLLIFFMLSSSLVFNPGIKVDLPQHTSSESVSPTDLVVTITKNNDVFFRGNYMSSIEAFKQLRLEFQRAVREVKDPRLIIEADVGVPFGRVVEIMSLAVEEGLHSQAIATRTREMTE